MYCYHCGAEVSLHEKFCARCGTNLQREEAATMEADQIPPVHQERKGTFQQATERVNRLVGEEGSVDVNLRDVFSSVLQKHTKDEAEQLFIAGTKTTTPEEDAISTSWPKPWLFSRVFTVLALTFVFLFICTIFFQNPTALPGMVLIGSFVVPFSLLILFWEMNAPRNISIYEVAKMFFVGGAASLAATMFLYEMFPVYDLTISSAIVVGVVEEVGKLAIIAYFVHKLNPKFILNGLLIGAAIGAGFAGIESAGYAFGFGEAMIMQVMTTRAWMSIGTHVVWSAIAGAALVYVKGEKPLETNHFLDAKFLRLFVVAIILHAVWDMPLYFLHNFHFLFIVLILIAWTFIFTLINAGLKQIVRWKV